MSPIIFLDLDGVIGIDGTLDKSSSLEWWSRDCGAELKRILDSTGAKIIVSSSWRYAGMDAVHNIFRLAGIENPEDYIIGETPKTLLNSPRGSEIKRWLNTNIGWDKFAIIDDDTDGMEQFPNQFFRTMFAHGLTRDIADRVIEFLKS